MKGKWRKYLKGDPVIWAVVLLLSIFSVLAVYSSTGTLAYRFQQGNTAYYILKHASFLMIGLILIFVTHLIPYKYYSRLSQLFLFLSIPLLGITIILGTTLNSAARWLTLPGIGLTFQTSDFAKLALIMYLARTLSLNQENIKDYKTAFLPVVIPVIVVCMLILPANFSTSAILLTTSVVLMFVGRINFKHLLALGGIGVLFITIFIVIALYTNREGRISTWKHRIESFSGKGDGKGSYQVDQAKIAIVTGGFFGKGPGNSTQRNFLPHPYSDFIYAIIIEEYGLWGGIVVLILYLFILYRAGVIVRKSERTFPAFLAMGLSFSLVFQAMINMAVAVNLLPVTGQTLPLVSMGGSSLLFTGIALGIVLSVSRGIQHDENEPPVATETVNNIENDATEQQA
jgi:cell division protein FtsW